MSQQDVLSEFGEALFSMWPYRHVDNLPGRLVGEPGMTVSECQRCYALTTNKLKHARACFTAMDDKSIELFGEALVQLIKQAEDERAEA